MNQLTRRGFIARTLTMGVGAAGWAALDLRAVDALLQGSLARDRTYAVDHFAVELNGAFAGWIVSGELKTKTETVRVGGRDLAGLPVPEKEVSEPATLITLRCGTGMSRTFYEWIQQSLAHRPAALNGAIMTCDFNDKVTSRFDWTGGVISGVQFPPLDAASRNPGELTINIQAQSSRRQAGSSAVLGKFNSRGAGNKWLESVYRFNSAGYGGALSYVSIVESLVLTPASAQGSFVFALPSARAKPISDSYDAFVHRTVEGNRGPDVQLGFLTPDLRENLFTLTFLSTMVTQLTAGAVRTRGSETPDFVTARMGFSDFRFDFGNGALGA
jgi:hypothetical protein